MIVSLVLMMSTIGFAGAAAQIGFSTASLSSTDEPSAPDVAVSGSGSWGAGAWVEIPPVANVGDAVIGDVWTESALSFAGDPAYDVALDVTEAGIAHAAYAVQLSRDDREIRYRSCSLSSGECTAGPKVSSTSARVNSLDLALDGVSTPQVVWSRTAGDAYYSECDGASWAEKQRLDSDTIVSQDAAISYGNDSVHVAWAETSPENRIWYGCRTSETWEFECIGSEDDRGRPGHPDVAAGSGRVFVVWDWCQTSSCERGLRRRERYTRVPAWRYRGDVHRWRRIR